VAQTKKQMDRSNRLACGYSIIRAADIYRFLGLSMLSQKKLCKGAGLPIIYKAAEAPEIRNRWDEGKPSHVASHVTSSERGNVGTWDVPTY